ncbi:MULTISPECIES: hypothetical protein [unclassified Rhizobium]|uniref:hypothetical protein n=1 Tax=unclassified Rhizobium TaxID=2613769 RepID=UPI001FCD1B14|nr:MULTISPECIES: hypothetical protein [unclassified Rhizobium]
MAQIDTSVVNLAVQPLLPMALSFIAISPFSGSITERLGKKSAISAGLAAMSLGNLLLGLSFLAGVGMGMATGPLTAVAVSTVTADRAGTASALINVARMVGATINVAVLGVIFAFLGEAETAFIVAMAAGGSVQMLASLHGGRSERAARCGDRVRSIVFQAHSPRQKWSRVPIQDVTRDHEDEHGEEAVEDVLVRA